MQSSERTAPVTPLYKPTNAAAAGTTINTMSTTALGLCLTSF